MRRIAYSSLAVVAVLLLLHSSGALAAEPACGASAKDAIAAAEKAVASKDDKGQARALACLLEAVKDLNAHRSDVERSDGNSVIHFQGAAGKKPRTQ